MVRTKVKEAESRATIDGPHTRETHRRRRPNTRRSPHAKTQATWPLVLRKACRMRFWTTLAAIDPIWPATEAPRSAAIVDQSCAVSERMMSCADWRTFWWTDRLMVCLRAKRITKQSSSRLVSTHKQTKNNNKQTKKQVENFKSRKNWRKKCDELMARTCSSRMSFAQSMGTWTVRQTRSFY